MINVFFVFPPLQVGEVMHKCEVEIEEEPEPPSFLDPIPDLTIMEYTPLTHKIRVGSQPKPDSIEWFLDEEKIRYGKDWQMTWEEPNFEVVYRITSSIQN